MQYVGVKVIRRNSTFRASTPFGAAALVFGVVTIGACFFEDAPTETGDRGVEDRQLPLLDFNGIGGLRVGKTISAAANEGMSLVQDGERFDGCVEMTVQSLPGVRTVVVADTIEIIEITGPTKTIRGVGPGSTKAEVRNAHQGQQLEERVNRFAFVEVAVAQSEEDDPLTLSYVSDEQGGLVTRVRAGRASSLVGYDEGCA